MHIISGDLWAGAEAMAYQLLSGLNQAKNIDLHLIIMNKGRLEQSCRQLGIKCYLLDEQKYNTLLIAVKALWFARKIKPDIIHSHRYKENILAAFISCLCGRPRLVATQHGRTESGKSGFNKIIINRLNSSCLRWIFTESVAVSKDTADYLLETCGLRQDKLSIIPNGINLPKPSQSASRNGTARFFTIGSAARLFPVKRFDTFIEIAKQVCQTKNHARFVIAGQGPEKEKLESLIALYGLDDQVRLLGHVDDMQAFYNGLDLYINTSMHEGTPMSVLEAMASGIPVIAFDVAGLKEIITNGSDGFTIPEGDSSVFASRIIELIYHPDFLETLGEKARKKILNYYSTARMVESYLLLYNRMAEKANQPKG